VRVAARVVFHGDRRTAVGVALTQHRVDRAALGGVVGRADLLLVVGLRIVGVVGDGDPLLLQLLDRGLQLRHGRRDVRQLDDVRLGGLGELAEFGQIVGGPLILGKELGDGRPDAPRQRDVAGLDLDPGGGRVRLHDRQQRVRREQWSLVGVGVDDLGHELRILPWIVVAPSRPERKTVVRLSLPTRPPFRALEKGIHRGSMAPSGGAWGRQPGHPCG
jgi:hypothetical protein